MTLDKTLRVLLPSAQMPLIVIVFVATRLMLTFEKKLFFIMVFSPWMDITPGVYSTILELMISTFWKLTKFGDEVML